MGKAKAVAEFVGECGLMAVVPDDAVGGTISRRETLPTIAVCPENPTPRDAAETQAFPNDQLHQVCADTVPEIQHFIDVTLVIG